jgi:tRNA pseudouridine32 synthase / 23S rRNA pseudouridine746 synthase
MHTPHFTSFNNPVTHIELPVKFTFPFYYDPHPIALQAAEELQEYIENQSDFDHNFGINKEQEGIIIGKMFGVLVVQKNNGELGYLAAFSGKLANGNHHDRFVPPVFDILKEDGFFRTQEEIISAINRKIELLENDPPYLLQQQEEQQLIISSQEEIAQIKADIKTNKALRDQKRKQYQSQLESNEINQSTYEACLQELVKQSLKESYYLKDRTLQIKETLAISKEKTQVFKDQIFTLKEERKTKSAACQQEIFDHYYFLDKELNKKSLGAIFLATEDQKPPAGAGECAAPKLLQYAFLHQLKPIALAEFWWGQSPSSEIKKHGQFYPACRGKCEPILGHMLEGIEMDENPMLTNPALGKELPIVFEDEYLAIVNKPAEFLSVPGKNISDSVYERVRTLYPDATGPLIVHRLDMSTSGLMLIAKTKEIHKHLQSQFLKRTVKKRYVALLDGIVKIPSGEINLPLRVDLDDRPRQLVCYDYGKPALTHFETFDHKNRRTKVYFYPITGRTHQLRVHAAHPQGLNTPIVGDDLYGTKGNRLHLHAESITFRHPFSKEIVTFQVDAEF